jgi:hypothetical protein
MKPIFICYSRKDLGTVKQIAEVLTAGGVRIWQDVDDLGVGNTELEIRKTIGHGCSGILVCVTEDSVGSVFVRDIELREAYKRRQSDPDFPIIPVFFMNTADADRRLSGSIPSGMSSYDGVVASNYPNVRMAAQKARQLLLKCMLGPLCGATAVIALSTRQPTSKAIDAHVDFDWSRKFPGAPSDFIEEDTLREFALPALSDLKQALLKAGCSRLQVHPIAHLTVGFAFGFVFKRETRFQIDIMQDGACWYSDSHENVDSPMTFHTEPGHIDSGKLAVVISLTQDARPAFNAFVASGGTRFRAIVYVAPTGRLWPLHVADGPSAVTIARELRKAIVSARSLYGCAEVHIFAAIPVGLSILLGRELNACGSIQLYEHDKDTGGYSPSWMLRNGDLG